MIQGALMTVVHPRRKAETIQTPRSLSLVRAAGLYIRPSLPKPRTPEAPAMRRDNMPRKTWTGRFARTSATTTMTESDRPRIDQLRSEPRARASRNRTPTKNLHPVVPRWRRRSVQPDRLAVVAGRRLSRCLPPLPGSPQLAASKMCTKARPTAYARDAQRPVFLAVAPSSRDALERVGFSVSGIRDGVRK
jgi:hypothetical protein